MNTQKRPPLSTPLRLFSSATLVSCVVFAAQRATAQTLIIPSEFANTEGSQVNGTVSNNPHRYQYLYLGSEFPQEPIEIIGIRRRPKSGTPTQSPVYRDLQIRLTTTKAVNLNTNFDANFNLALQPPTFVINGTVQTSTVRPVPNQSPRSFDYEFLWEATPFRFDPADGTSLLVDFHAPYGVSVPQQHDSIDSATQRPGKPLSVLQSPAHNFHGYDGRFPVTQFIYRRVPRELPGDYNGSGAVEQGDLDLVLLNWGQGGATPPVGWIHELPTGTIGQSHLDSVLLNWGKTSPAIGAKSIP